MFNSTRITHAVNSFSSPRRCSRRRFTLIEMLVVITIIAILAAMLSPSLMNALESARSVSCRNKLKNIFFATMSYVSDSSGYLPPHRTVSNRYWFTKDVLGGYLGNQSTYDATRCEALRCPTAKGYGFGNAGAAGYAINYFLCPSIMEASLVRLSDVRIPSKTIYMLDGLEFRWIPAWKCTKYWYGWYDELEFIGNPYSTSAGSMVNFSYRHHNAPNVTFCDGRVANLDIAAARLNNTVSSCVDGCPTPPKD